MYNETNHWEECKICGEKQNKTPHTIKNIWETGVASCKFNNFCTKICTCGYSEVWNKPCVWDGKSYYTSGYKHARLCKNCGFNIEHSYYLNTYGAGQLYKVDKGDEENNNMNYCRKSDGTRLDCNNKGTCATCKTVYNNANHYMLTNQENGKIYCRICNTEYGTVEKEIQKSPKIPTTYTIVENVTLKNGAKYLTTEGLRDVQGLWSKNTQTVSNKNSTGTQFTLTSIGEIKNTYKVPVSIYTACFLTINGVDCRCILTDIIAVPDSVEPVINTITAEGTTILTEWTKSKPIVVSGTENYCNTVTLEIIDDNGISIYKGSGNVTNNKYSISCIPDIEADLNGKVFTAIATDACNNSTTKEFTISKVDGIAPEPISENEIGGKWAKTKNFTFKSTDRGIGNVQIAFNDIEDLQPANLNENNEYEREYEFTGDVYQPKELSVLYKDELGNTSIQKITIDKLDNTAPTITNARIHNNKLTIDANDIKEGMGEGSGVVKYRYITSESKLENQEVSETATEVNIGENFIIPNIDKVKYIYIVAEDLVGNISESYEYEVPQLILTSKVNLSAANGKGGVDLDWSSYDLEDKYFVVYRKQENEIEWEKIVPIEQKLTGGKYTDILANDQTKPSVPSISIEGNSTNNNIQITQGAIDTGTKYVYYIEAYSREENILIASSK